MAKVMSMAVLILCLTIGWPAYARNTKHLLPIAVAMESKDAQEKLDRSVKFYFGDQPPPPVLTALGSDISNRKTNAFGKSDEKPCNWAFLSAMVALQTRAQRMGANAVINIVSYYNKTDVERHRLRMPCRGNHCWHGVET